MVSSGVKDNSDSCCNINKKCSSISSSNSNTKRKIEDNLSNLKKTKKNCNERTVVTPSNSAVNINSHIKSNGISTGCNSNIIIGKRKVSFACDEATEMQDLGNRNNERWGEWSSFALSSSSSLVGETSVRSNSTNTFRTIKDNSNLLSLAIVSSSLFSINYNKRVHQEKIQDDEEKNEHQPLAKGEFETENTAATTSYHKSNKKVGNDHQNKDEVSKKFETLKKEPEEKEEASKVDGDTQSSATSTRTTSYRYQSHDITFDASNINNHPSTTSLLRDEYNCDHYPLCVPPRLPTRNEALAIAATTSSVCNCAHFVRHHRFSDNKTTLMRTKILSPPPPLLIDENRNYNRYQEKGNYYNSSPSLLPPTMTIKLMYNDYRSKTSRYSTDAPRKETSHLTRQRR